MRSELALDIEFLASCTESGEGISRVAWSQPLAKAYERVQTRMRELGMHTAVDGAGNLIGRWLPDDPARDNDPAVAMGSHLDSVPHGGNYDGTLGVLCALEAIRIAQRAGTRPQRPVWVIAFMDEEGARFGAPLFGSRAFTGEPMGSFAALTDPDGITVRRAMADWGHDFDRVTEGPGVAALGQYLELHIEQGPVLETADIQIGVVEAISGGRGLRVRLTGTSGHSGTIPMSMRRDPVVGAAKVIAALPSLTTDRDDLRLTVGRVQASPGALNVVAQSCEFFVDVRSIAAELIDDGVEAVRSTCAQVAADLGLEVSIDVLHDVAPLTLDSALVDLVEDAAQDEDASHLRLSSGAGHDALLVGRHVPAAMVFVPSRGGVSHRADEFTELADCERGARVLARVLMNLASRPG